ncbi:tetratricopeptide repeat protein [Luteibacter sp. UNCMF366Tsu5.1]|uniref:tetratricopeptide repeat protein n=1 Tax=Luteibacter sp. UNCMF366Tsu5.1 TaxID=1502758 RepID=UPI0009086FF1|nr:tetratricopeptide repeat protein [Luteibacter sp. UNCMF366Tsu5.1]SFW69331.1 Tetratricopeptide repeat-containing protein [Luteibacter sp. UNCMF366Tsu5.1]
MKQGSFIKLALATAIALSLASGAAVARDTAPKDKKEALYPNATRTEPKLDLKSEKDQKALNEGLDAANNGEKDKALQLLQPLADGSATSSKYAQALALQGIANMKYNDGDVKGAITTLKQALDIGVMPNDTYFQLKYMYTQFLVADEQYDAALKSLQEWRAEGKKETADSYGLEGNIDYRLGKFPEAIAAITKAKSLPDAKPQGSWDQILAASYAETGQGDKAAELAAAELQKNPNDPTALNNAASALIQAQKYPDAIALMEKGRAAGAFKDEKQYINLAKVYLIDGQDHTDRQEANAAKAAAVLDDGLAKGVVKPSAEVYKLQGDAAITAGKEDAALAAYQKAAPLAKDGEVMLSVARLQLQKNQYAAAEKSATDAISKGVQHKGQAYMVRAEAKRGQKNKQGAIADMKLAAQDPETSAKANAWLKTAGTGK